MKAPESLLGGLAGATALTLVHETTKHLLPQAPRMDLMGMQALSKIFKKAKQPVPEGNKLFAMTMAGDLLSNALYYSVAGISSDKNVVLRSTFMGFTAGIGAITLPKPMGLSEAPSKRTPLTAVLTVALYTFGGLAAGVAMKLLQSRKKEAAPKMQLVM